MMTRPLRAKRKAATVGLTVAVTGAATPLGQVICRQLAAAEGIRKVLALDTRKPAVPLARWRRTDATEPELADALTKVDALVHLGVLDGAGFDAAAEPATAEADPLELRRRAATTASVAITAAAATAVKHVILLSSARVYGAFPDNPVPLPEDAPLRAVPDGSTLDALLAVEEYAERAAAMFPAVGLTVLRPAPLLGRDVDHPSAGLLEGPRLLMVTGSRPAWQFCHVDDLASAVVTVVRNGLLGPITVGSEGWLEQHEVERILGHRRVQLPAEIALATAARLHALGITGDPTSQLGYLMHPWVVSSARLRAAGWEPVHTNADALAGWAGGRPLLPLRLTARGATAAAGATVGATVALVGTAALVRRARRRRKQRR
jgi:nucleoside-diphosphate-sugar epimerase